MTSISKIFILITAGLICVGWGTPSAAQSTHLTAKNTGLGGGGTAYIDGYHANFINPANIMLGEGEKPRRTIGFIGGVSTNMGGGLANINVYNSYFTTGRTVTGSVADEALTKWFGNDPTAMKNLGMQTEVIPLGLSYRGNNWGMSAAFRSRLVANTSANKGFAQLGLVGFDSRVFGSGQPINFSGEVVSFHEVSIGLSLKLLEIENFFGLAENIKLYAGAAPKKILGSNAYKVDFNSVLTMEGDGENTVDAVHHEFNYSFETTGELSNQFETYYNDRQSREGNPDINDYISLEGKDFYGISSAGWGLDIGSTLEMDLSLPLIGAFFKGPEHLQVGVSLTDIGKYSFTENAGRFSAADEFVWRGFSLDQERIDEEFDGNRGDYMSHVLQDSIASDIYGSFAPEETSSISRSLPTMVNFGGHLTMNRLSVSIDLMQGFNEVGTNSRRAALATGVEYDLFGFMPLRVGMRNGGYSSTNYSAGSGIEFRNFEFSVGASTVSNSEHHGSSIGAAWSGFVFRF